LGALNCIFFGAVFVNQPRNTPNLAGLEWHPAEMVVDFRKQTNLLQDFIMVKRKQFIRGMKGLPALEMVANR